MSKITVDERGFVKAGPHKLCRRTEGGVEFQVRGRYGKPHTVTVPVDTFAQVIKSPLQGDKDSATLGESNNPNN